MYVLIPDVLTFFTKYPLVAMISGHCTECHNSERQEFATSEGLSRIMEYYPVSVSKRLNTQGAVSIRKTVLPGMAIPMLKIRRPNGRLIFNMEIAIRR